MKINDILSIIKNYDENAIVNGNLIQYVNLDFVPASTKNLIPNGIYYFTGDDFNVEFKNSIILTDKNINPENCVIVKTTEPQLVFYKMCSHFEVKTENIIHSTAIISSNAKIGKNVHVGPYSIIGDCTISDNCRLMNHVVIEDNVILEENVFIDSHTIVGASGLAWIWDKNGNRVVQPQIGGVLIRKFASLATDITVVRGSLSENTEIGEHTVIAHGTKIGHGAQIGQLVHMANNVSIAGNASISERAFLGSACVISSNVKIPIGAIVGAGAVVTKSFEQNHITLAGVPAKIISVENYNSKPKGAPKPFKK